jgi:hypothetical protein
MKKAIFVFFITLPFLAFSQKPRVNSKSDSLSYYRKLLVKIRRDNDDSLRHSEEYTSTLNNIIRLHPYHEKFTGVILFGELLHSNFEKFNKSILSSGFSSMPQYSFRIGLGFSRIRGRKIFDFNYLTAGFKSKSKSVNDVIESSLTNWLQFDLGYDILKSKNINLYPYGGISYRSSSIKYKTPTIINPFYTNITNIILSDRSLDLTSNKLGYQLGIGLDVRIINKSQKGNTSMYLFSKFGTNRPFGSENYKANGISYKPSNIQGDWLVSFGLKLGGWNNQ